MRLAAPLVGFCALLLVIGFSSSHGAAATDDLLSTDKTDVNVRSAPSTDADIVARLNAGEIVIEINSSNGWFFVNLPDQQRQGWVFGPLLKRVTAPNPKPVPVSATPSPSIDDTVTTGRPASASERLMARLTPFDETLVGDPKRGEAVFYKCGACHTTIPGTHADGPSLYGVIGRAPASAPGYRYSGGMQAFAREGAIWDKATLDRFIQRPPRIVNGTSMPFSGIRNPRDRRDLIAYLEELSN